MAGFSFTTIASSANGPLVQSLSPSQAAQLVFYASTFNTSAFDQLASSLANQDMQTVENHEPEGTRNQLTINGWNGQAGNAANAINNAWHAGKVTGPGGHPTTPWPDAGYNGQLAWADAGGNTLVLRWMKEQPMAYILVGILVVVVGYLVYQVLTSGTWNLSTAKLGTAGGTPGTSGGVPFIGSQPGGPFRVLWFPWYDTAAIAAGAVALPFLYHKFVEVEGDRVTAAKERIALRRLGRGGGGGG